MVEALADWARQMVILIMVTTFLEALVPENGMKKFVRVAVGFFILVAVAQPLLQFLPGAAGWSLTMETPTPVPVAGEVAGNQEDLVRVNDVLIRALFLEKVADEAERVGEGAAPEVAVRAVAEGSEQEGVRRLKLYLKWHQDRTGGTGEGEENSTSNKVWIAPVKVEIPAIGGQTNEGSPISRRNIVGQEKKMIEERVRQQVAEYFRLPLRQVEVGWEEDDQG